MCAQYRDRGVVVWLIDRGAEFVLVMISSE